VGNHVLSGAVIDPAGFDGLLTDAEYQAKREEILGEV